LYVLIRSIVTPNHLFNIGFPHKPYIVRAFSDLDRAPQLRFYGLIKTCSGVSSFKWAYLSRPKQSHSSRYFNSSTIVLTNMTIFEVAVGVTALAVGVEDEDEFQRRIYI
jgi:hypothetical protein